jgi:ABC-2 type transport system ATP-binding protein
VGKARQLPPARIKEAIDRVVTTVEIERMLKKNIGHLSKGYRQRVGLAQALIHDPPILVLDEPTSGLDPHQIIEIRELLRDLGKTKVIIFSSHILQEISAICTRIIIIKDGRLVADGTPRELQAKAAGRQVLRLRVQGPEGEVRTRLAETLGVDSVDVLGRQGAFIDYRVRGAAGDDDLGVTLSRAVMDRGWPLSALEPEARSLEDIYLQLTAAKAQARAS